MSSSRLPPPSKLHELDITIISAKHLKNVNWRQGDLKPYVTVWVEPGRRFTTKPDDSSSTRPVWNERFVIAFNSSLHDTLLSLEISHLDTPSPLVGSLQFPLKDLVDDPSPLRTLYLRRPSGRPQGKIRVKFILREFERPSPPPDYHYTPQPSYYYSSSAPPPPLPSRYPPSPSPSLSPSLSPYAPSPVPYGTYSDPYPGYYPGYYSHPPPLPPRPFLDQASNYGAPPSGPSGLTGPSAPVDYSSYEHNKPKVGDYSSYEHNKSKVGDYSSYEHNKPKVGDYSSYDHKAKGGIDYSSYEHKAKGSKMGLGTGLAVGGVAGALGGLTLEEGLKYEEDKIAERVENDLAARDDYNDYHNRAHY